MGSPHAGNRKSVVVRHGSRDPLAAVDVMRGQGYASGPPPGVTCTSHSTLRAGRIKDTSHNELKGTLKQKHAQLTEDDLLYAKGKEDELLGRLQKKLGQGQDEKKKVPATKSGETGRRGIPIVPIFGGWHLLPGTFCPLS